MAFPTTSVLDNFTRANEGPPPSASWLASSIFTGTSALQVTSNTLQSASSAGGGWGTTAGPDSEVYVTISTLMANLSNCNLWLRGADVGTVNEDGYKFTVQRQDGFPGFGATIVRVDNDSGTQLGATINDTGGAMSAAEKLGCEAIGSNLTMYYNRGSWVSLGSRTDATYAGAGYMLIASTDSAARYDDFGGGTVVTGGASLASDTPMPIAGRGATW